MLSLDGVEAQLYAPDWDGELPLDRARQKGLPELVGRKTSYYLYHLYHFYIILWPGLSSISTHGLSAMFDFKVEGVKFETVSILQVVEST